MADYCVYCHTFPNGKKYIGISKDVERRWQNGQGYKGQTKMNRAIKKYGWGNVCHEILMQGLTRCEAERAEKNFISVFNSVENGYNSTIGGESIKETYLDTYVLDMIRSVKSYTNKDERPLPELVYGDRFNKAASGLWNEASKAVIKKHGFFSNTNERECGQYWYYMGQYFELWIRMENGEDVSDWKEIPFEEAIYNMLFVWGQTQ